jgi:hypothetical protein
VGIGVGTVTTPSSGVAVDIPSTDPLSGPIFDTKGAQDDAKNTKNNAENINRRGMPFLQDFGSIKNLKCRLGYFYNLTTGGVDFLPVESEKDLHRKPPSSAQIQK